MEAIIDKKLPRELFRDGTLFLTTQGCVVGVNPTSRCYIYENKRWRLAKGQLPKNKTTNPK